MNGDDPEADEFAAFFRQHMNTLRGYLINAGGDASFVDDILQDTFLATKLYWGKVRDYDKPEAYLYKVASRQLGRYSKNRYLRTEPHAEPPIPATFRADAITMADAIREALERLSLRQRQVILLCYTYGFTIKETAKILSIAEGTVKRCRSDALSRLRAIMADVNDSDEGRSRG
ncbi:sigma-70 family RNA polymerase sigma factor [Actinomadura fulvescens]|uniref:SigE family RNA polymerase sigma factor n=1 Tax=Actinomadura fulvescens TaxID=46160 RepID=A0ABN3QFV1_9ACTN